MVKALKKRFIVTAMLSLFILLLVINAAVMAVGYISVSRDARRTLDVLSNEQMMMYDFGGRGPKFLDYFTVITNENGEMVLTNIVFDPTVSAEQAAEYTKTALEQGGRGRIGSYRYSVTHLSVGGYRLVFLDISSQLETVGRLIKISLLVSLFSMLLMLVIVALVSERAIKPVAESFEKQKRFVTDAGHEIKTPLAIIQANTDALELCMGENKWSKNIRSQTLRLTELMKKLLALSKMDEGEQSFPFADVDFSSLAASAAEDFEPLAEKRGCVIEAHVQPGITLRGNKPSLTELLNVLLDNAVKYSSDNSAIELEVGTNGKKCEITVSNKCDSLPDVPPETLFDRFYRADSARTQSSGGVGIGLSTAKAIAELHKGKIEAVFGEENTVRFRVEMPCAVG